MKESKPLQPLSTILMPLYSNLISAGFPSPADDELEKELDLHEFLVQHPAATFFLRVKGNSMINAGIFDGDILIVDRALEAKEGSIVVATVDGEFVVKRLRRNGRKIWLYPENPKYKPLQVFADRFEVWGVVTYVLHRV